MYGLWVFIWLLFSQKWHSMDAVVDPGGGEWVIPPLNLSWTYAERAWQGRSHTPLGHSKGGMLDVQGGGACQFNFSGGGGEDDVTQSM